MTQPYRNSVVIVSKTSLHSFSSSNRLHKTRRYCSIDLPTTAVSVPLPRACGWPSLRPRWTCTPCPGRSRLHTRTVRRPRPSRPKSWAYICRCPCARLRAVRSAPAADRRPWTTWPEAEVRPGPVLPDIRIFVNDNFTRLSDFLFYFFSPFQRVVDLSHSFSDTSASTGFSQTFRVHRGFRFRGVRSRTAVRVRKMEPAAEKTEDADVSENQHNNSQIQ